MDVSHINLAFSTETGSIGIMHLKRFWEKALAKKAQYINNDAYAEEWNTDVTLLKCLGLGLEPALKYLYTQASTFSEFEQWIISLNGGNIEPSRINNFNLLICNNPLTNRVQKPTYSVFTAKDWDFWDQNGYLVIKEAVSKQHCNDVIDVMCEIMQIDLNDASTWYNAHHLKQGIMVQIFQHPALQASRNSEKIRIVYEELWGRTDLWVSTDRVSFNPPENKQYKFPGPHLHWDVSLKLPIPFGLQGLLYLSDTSENQGAFTLIPGFHTRIGNWLNSLDKETDPRREILNTSEAKPIAAKAGDFIIWHQALPHGSSPNTSNLPRMVQYINYLPADFEQVKDWL